MAGRGPRGMRKVTSLGVRRSQSKTPVPPRGPRFKPTIEQPPLLVVIAIPAACARTNAVQHFVMRSCGGFSAQEDDPVMDAIEPGAPMGRHDKCHARHDPRAGLAERLHRPAKRIVAQSAFAKCDAPFSLALPRHSSGPPLAAAQATLRHQAPIF
jgi:hypothetical protein